MSSKGKGKAATKKKAAPKKTAKGKAKKGKSKTKKDPNAPKRLVAIQLSKVVSAL